VLIGHVTRDVLDGGTRAGGTVLYAGVAAARLGRRVGIATVCGADFELPAELADVDVARRDAAHTTTFALTAPVALATASDGASPGERTLRLLERAPALRAADVPPTWRTGVRPASAAERPDRIVHLAPVADEVPRGAVAWCRGGQVVATPQGWLRRFGLNGEVAPLSAPLEALPSAGLDALVLSVEDVGGDEEAIHQLGRRVPVLVATRGARGCTVYARGPAVDVPSPPAREVDATGAGDVFAAAFFVRLGETGDPVASACFAACAAALSVEGRGLSRIPTRAQVEARLDTWAAS
jgi:sugar/nucleoside kinase (ribokinase family)